MGSRVLLPALLFTVACAAGALYWVSLRDGGGGAAEGTRAVATPEAGEAPDLAAPRTLEQERLSETTSVRPERTAVEQLEVPAAAQEPARSEERVRGLVLDTEGQPVVGASVTASDRPGGLPLDWGEELEDEPRFRAVTDREGRFELVGMRPGAARFALRASGFAPLDDNDVALPAGGTVELRPFVMSRGAVLSGRVLDPAGRGVAGAELSVQRERDGLLLFGGSQQPDVVSGQDGSFVLDQVACGKWKVRVVADEHPAATFEGMADQPGRTVGGLEFRLGEGAMISGTVSDVPREEAGELFVSARPVRSGDFATLSSFGDARRAEVAMDGSFELHGLEPGTEYLLEARAAAGTPEYSFFFGGRSRSDQVRARAGDRGVQLRFQEGATLTFRVLDARSREPITDFKVRYGTDFLQPLRDDDGKPITQHPDGVARVDRLRMASDDQRLQLEIEATGYETFHREGIAILRGEVLDLGRIFLEPVPTLTVRVRERDGRAPIAGAHVSLREPREPGTRIEHRISIGGEEEDGGVVLGGGDASATTDEDGIAVLNVPEGERRHLRVARNGFAPFESEPLYFAPGEDVEEVVELGPGGSLLVQVLEADGTPMAGARVQRRSPSEIAGDSFQMGTAEARNVTDTQGRLRFDNLEPGVHALRLREGDGSGGFFGGGEVQIQGLEVDQEGWTEAEVVEGEEVLVTLYASPRGSLRGRVGESGLALAGATLTLVDEEQKDDPMAGMALPGMSGGPRARTDGRGDYLFDDVKAGRYLLRVEHPTRHMPAELSVVVREGENRFDVSLSVAIVEGRITDQSGEPLAGLRVSATRAEGQGGARRFVMIMEASNGGGAVVSGGSGLDAERVYTDADGRYSLRGVATGVDLQVRAEGDEIQDQRSERFSVAEGEVKRGVDLACEAAGSIEVEALMPDGSPARFCLVRATYAGEETDVSPEFSFLESGSTVLGGLRPGPWDLNVERQGGGAGAAGSGGTQVRVEVQAGERAHETVHLN